jgi:site-specific DNA-methyltransferase (adenine-specific)
VAFNEEWLSLCQELLAEHGTLWTCASFRSLPALGYAVERVGLGLLCEVIWEKSYPQPNRTRRCFAHATESLLWSAKHKTARYRFNYGCMREQNGGKQMTSHWRMPTVPRREQVHGHHPTQKPLGLVERCIVSTTGPGDLILDPFLGSGTTAVAALRHGRRCIGIDQDTNYLELARRRVTAEAMALSSVATSGAGENVGRADAK